MYKRFGKVAITLALISPPSFMLADEGDGSGFFAGINTGYSVSFVKTTTTGQGTTNDETTAQRYLNIGVQLGYNYMLTDFFGLRGYLDYNYGFHHTHTKTTETQNQTTDATTSNSSHAISVNVDVLLNILSSDTFAFGAYAGIGLGYATMSGAEKTNEQGQITTLITQGGDGFILPINLGLSLTANNHHRFELGFKIPTLGVKYTPPANQNQGNNNNETTTTRNLITTIGYSYIF
ncbi:outer membrane beta-barrel protein [Helicobacter bilis]|uniref:Outer membrane beta-barrel protein n=1 Tax=Helicobacter bilis TaxID=37372 RepID=A0A4U8UAC2_9HELI|nr:outer membrane beta-barrel protein [Helicobacter bilis]MCI7410129.1 outer membrane protein [Helicobacter bilis]MDD7296182.1 outer membrane beta-barrel protein [Helicobacter bilis]MDY4401037.1 outer membrane beta-barrel protein [Helicobacter bilis]TLE11503.1 outer membrane beta-barrel protein [Helicobacter bilis]